MTKCLLKSLVNLYLLSTVSKVLWKKWVLTNVREEVLRSPKIKVWVPRTLSTFPLSKCRRVSTNTLENWLLISLICKLWVLSSRICKMLLQVFLVCKTVHTICLTPSRRIFGSLKKKCVGLLTIETIWKTQKWRIWKWKSKNCKNKTNNFDCWSQSSRISRSKPKKMNSRKNWKSKFGRKSCVLWNNCLFPRKVILSMTEIPPKTVSNFWRTDSWNWRKRTTNSHKSWRGWRKKRRIMFTQSKSSSSTWKWRMQQMPPNKRMMEMTNHTKQGSLTFLRIVSVHQIWGHFPSTSKCWKQ